MIDVLDNRLAIFDYGNVESDRPVQIDDKEFVLIETDELGKARLNVSLHGESILFSHLDRDRGASRFIKNKKMADHLILEYREGTWKVHIVEFKRSVGADTWSDIKNQFFGGLVRSFQFCGILGISVDSDEVYLYSAYQRDRFQGADSLVDARIRFHGMSMGIIEEWTKDKEYVEISDGFVAKHRKIKMDYNEKQNCMIGNIIL